MSAQKSHNARRQLASPRRRAAREQSATSTVVVTVCSRPPPAAPRQWSILEAGGAHGLVEGRVNARLAPSHGLQGVPKGDGRQAVGRRHADVEGDKAIPSCRTGEHVGRAEARRGREEAESLGFSVGVATAGKCKEAIPCLVVATGGWARRAAQGMRPADHAGASTNTADGIRWPSSSAEPQTDGVHVDAGLQSVP